ncbi:Zn-dependent hydrolase [Microbacterium gubbeenense]|uniref:Zn-dependent hydrolase n=1 Tax=Microbacterium gubbeenense TaxID=159896 RepID=UPI0003F6D5DC|nr:Zn-dependent hydrolase [Microbacterium gubbeenense]
MTSVDLESRIAANAARLSADLEAFAAISEPGDGVTRLAYTALERRAHDVFAERMRTLGCVVHTDAAGNTIADLPATEDNGPQSVVGTGSHLDSVAQGGRFDGIAGVVAGMEAAYLAALSPVPRRRRWRFVAFAAEEGARFGQACNGSRMVAGLTTLPDTRRLRDTEGVSMYDAMSEVGLRPDDLAADEWDAAQWHAFVELHVEQGAVLEDAGVPIGIVDSISGSTRLHVAVNGTASHTGATPMHKRRDALVTAASCVLAGDRIAKDSAHHGTRVTVGRLEVSPGAMTTIPGRVEFVVDVRDIDSDRQRTTVEQLAAAYRDAADADGTAIIVDVIADTSPVVLPAVVKDHLAAAAEQHGLGYRLLSSGASHDAQQVNKITPTGMIFVPSAGGLSHVPNEHTDADDLACGVDVLLAALYRLDADE